MAIDSARAPDLLDDAVAIDAIPETELQIREGPGTGRRVSRVAVVVASILVLAAIFGPLFSGAPTRVHLTNRLVEPVGFGGTWSHPLGTDGLGRDVLAGLLAGARTSLLVGFGAVVLAALIGLPLGLLAGYRRGEIDSVVTWLVDFQLGFPRCCLSSSSPPISGPACSRSSSCSAS